MVNERIDDVSEDEGPRSPQAVLHLPEQQADKQVIHEEDAMALVAVGRLRRSRAHRQQNPLDGHLRHGERGPEETCLFKDTGDKTRKWGSIIRGVCVLHVTGVLERMATRDLCVALWHLLR